MSFLDPNHRNLLKNAAASNFKWCLMIKDLLLFHYCCCCFVVVLLNDKKNKKKRRRWKKKEKKKEEQFSMDIFTYVLLLSAWTGFPSTVTGEHSKNTARLH